MLIPLSLPASPHKAREAVRRRSFGSTSSSLSFVLSLHSRDSTHPHLSPQTIVILPICGPLVASYLYRFLTSESSDPFSYTADVPPDWHIPPAELAPDSSDSGGEMEYYELGSTKSGYASPRPTAMVELSEADGQPESQSKQIDRSKWSKVRRDRKRQVSGAYGRLADV